MLHLNLVKEKLSSLIFSENVTLKIFDKDDSFSIIVIVTCWDKAMLRSNLSKQVMLYKKDIFLFLEAQSDKPRGLGQSPIINGASYFYAKDDPLVEYIYDALFLI